MHRQIHNVFFIKYIMLWWIYHTTKTKQIKGPTIKDGHQNSWPFPIGTYKVWLTDNYHSTAWFLINKINDDDVIIDVGDHIHYHITNGTEEALPHVL